MRREVVTIRTKSRGVQRRAGLLLTPLHTWVEHELDLSDANFVQASRTVLDLVQDPGITVEMRESEDGEAVWLPAPAAAALERFIKDKEQAESDLTGAWLHDPAYLDKVESVLAAVKADFDGAATTELTPAEAYTGADEEDQSRAPVEKATAQTGEPENPAPATITDSVADPVTPEIPTPPVSSNPAPLLGEPKAATSETKPKAAPRRKA